MQEPRRHGSGSSVGKFENSTRHRLHRRHLTSEAAAARVGRGQEQEKRVAACLRVVIFVVS